MENELCVERAREREKTQVTSSKQEPSVLLYSLRRATNHQRECTMMGANRHSRLVRHTGNTAIGIVEEGSVETTHTL